MEPIVHAIIPLAFLLALFPNLDKKYVLYLVPIVWIIDLDTFIGIHRFTFHNLSFVFLLAIITYTLWRNRAAFWVALYYGCSHLLLDFTKPGPAWFYPFVQKTYYLEASIQRSSEWILHYSMGSLSLNEYQTFIQTIGPARYIGETSILFLVLFGILLLIKWKKKIISKFMKN